MNRLKDFRAVCTRFDKRGHNYHAVVLGDGRPLFEPGGERTRLRLLGATPLRTGCVILRYAPDPAA